MVCRKHYVVFECLVLNCVFVEKKVLNVHVMVNIFVVFMFLQVSGTS